MHHPSLLVRDKETNAEYRVNTTPPDVINELKKPKHERSVHVLAAAHEPYYNPSKHEIIDEEKKTKPRVKPAAAKSATPVAAPAAPDDDDDDDEDDDD